MEKNPFEGVIDNIQNRGLIISRQENLIKESSLLSIKNYPFIDFERF
jgi:hypothetical protein